MSDDNKNLIVVKAVLIGDSGVGKTSMIKQFTLNIFDTSIQPSISSQFVAKEVNITDTKKTIKFDLWDTAGQELYRSLAKIFYKDAGIIIFVYDITSKLSFESLQKYWYQQVSSNSLPNAIFALAGNKNDLYKDAEVDEKEAINWADKIGAIFTTTSAKTNIGIDSLFDTVGKKYLNPNYNYKIEENEKKKQYEMKKENKKDIKDKDDEDFDNNIPDAVNIKLDNNNKKKKICC